MQDSIEIKISNKAYDIYLRVDFYIQSCQLFIDVKERVFLLTLHPISAKELNIILIRIICDCSI